MITTPAEMVIPPHPQPGPEPEQQNDDVRNFSQLFMIIPLYGYKQLLSALNRLSR
jgi:hypothetical protein